MQVHLARVAKRKHRSVDIDLHGPCLTFFRKELRPRKSAADDEECVALGHHVRARTRSKEADGAGHEGKVVFEHRFPEERFRDSSAELLGKSNDLVSSFG